MGSSSIPVNWICRRCILRGCQQRTFSTGTIPSTRPVPPRIFATEENADDAYRLLANSGTPERTKAEKQKRYDEWLEKRFQLASSTERLSNEFRKRLGRQRPAGLLEATNGIYAQTGTTMMSRMIIKPNNDLPPLNQVAPADLLQAQENVETRDTIMAAIDGCISAALERLELSGLSSDSTQRSSKNISVPHDQYIWLASILEFQFAKHQLVDYGHESGLRKSHLLKAKTSDAIGMILKEVWNLDKEPELPPDETLVTKNIPITRRERFFMIGEDGGGTLWRWVYHCQARIVADLNKAVLRVTATPANLKKLEWVIRQMFKDSENDDVDVKVLRPLGKFDASYFLPVIARLSSTYLEVSNDKKDELGITALGVSALGKKRHRVEVARRLVFGSVVASFESRKDILYPEESKKNALFRVLDCSLPWWTERDSWGRWTSISSGPKDSAIIPKLNADTKLCLSTIKSQTAIDASSSMALSQVIQSLANEANGGSSQKRVSIVALPGHVLHNMRKLRTESKRMTAHQLMQSASQSAGDVSPSHIFSPHNINSAAILKACRVGNHQTDYDHIYTMSFTASPWDFPDTFHRIPQMTLRVIVDSSTWDVTDINASLIFGCKYTDVMLPSLGCDLRLQRKDYLPIPAQSVESFTRYIQEIRFDPSRNRRLTAPPFLQLDLELESTSNSSVKYFLTKMNFRRELNRTFWGHHLVYADIDGGEAWGRRKQMKLVITDYEKPLYVVPSIDAIEAMISRGSG